MMVIMTEMVSKMKDLNWLALNNVLVDLIRFFPTATALTSFCLDYYSLKVFAAVFGARNGAHVVLSLVILVDLLGLEKLCNALGLLALCRGIAFFICPLIAGT